MGVLQIVLIVAGNFALIAVLAVVFDREHTPELTAPKKPSHTTERRFKRRQKIPSVRAR